MKRCFKYHNLLLLLAWLLAATVPSACSDETWTDGGRTMEGTPTEITLNFDVLSPRERDVRAAQSVEYEYKVTNLYVMEFDSNGKRVDKDTDRGTGNFFSIDKGNISNAHNKANESDATSSGTISLQGVTGSGMKIVGIANVGTSSASLTMDELNGVETLADLNRLTTSINAQEGGNIYRGAAFLMTGYAVAGTGTSASTDIDIAYGASLSAKIMLERVDSKVTFNVRASNAKYKDMKFTPKQWKVVSVPHQTRVMENENVDVEDVITESRDADGADCTYFESSATKFEQTSDNFGSFTFYMYENLKKPKLLIRDQSAPSDLNERTDQEWRYACREEQRKATTATGAQQILDYKYAPDDATYVQMTGELSYKDGDKYVLADVTYTVHLGYAKQAGPQADDYRTERNSHYTYNITITGVNSLIAEVEKNREERPGAEGDVVISGDEVKTFDSHYCRTKFTLTAEQVSNLIFAVKTPFDNGIQTADGTSEVKDYKWVKFLINKEAGVSDSRLAAYPGEQCYDGGASETGASSYSGAYGKNVTLRDAKQLVKYLNAQYKGQNVTVTAFIDEYLYTYNPITDAYRAPNASNPDLTLWKEGIGHGNRMLHLVPGGLIKTSADGRTTVAHSAMTFVQRPIETIYDVDNSGLETAWGTEMVNETGVINCPREISGLPSTGATSRSDGLSNTRAIATNSSLKWADLLSSTEENKMSSTYNSPLYAWALRNRDFDGDGVVDRDEVVWYLASINEMQDLWIGENALSAPLFDENDCDKMNRTLNNISNATYDLSHYITSTVSRHTDGTLTPWVYWAEEYGATSTHMNAADWTGFSANGTSPRRCRYLRHLGLENGVTTAPQTYYTIGGGTPNLSSKTAITTNAYTIELTYLNKNAIRKTLDNGRDLPYSNLGEAGENNLPSMKFQVAPSSGILPAAKNSAKWTAEDGTAWSDFYKGSVTYTNGYRMPNQREMVLMSNYLDGWAFKNTYTSGWWSQTETITKAEYTMRNAQKINYTRNGTSGFYYGAFTYIPLSDILNRGSYFGATLDAISNKFYVRPVKDL